jgi:hypothetical protein
VAADKRRDRQNNAQVPVLWHDSILRNAYISALMLGLVLGGLSVFGLIRYPHWIWVAPIASAVLALAANQRIRNTTGRRDVIVLGLLTLVLLVGAGLLAGLAIRIAR